MNRNHFSALKLVVATALVLGAGNVFAQASLSVGPGTDPRQIPPPVRVTPQEQVMMETQAFIQSHPDLLYLNQGAEALKYNDLKSAFRNFELAGLYGDKIGQAMVAEMLWQGRGVAVDRPRAYAMMDIAAERGTNENLLVLREQYWAALSESERKQALAIGSSIVSRFSDDEALKRLQMTFNADKRSRIRTMPGMLQVTTTGNDGGEQQVRGDQLLADRLWDAQTYMNIRDDLVNRVIRNGRIRIKLDGKEQTVQAKSSEQSDQK